MATWTDRQRGTRQGRIEPQLITPPHGDHVFVLGSIDDAELAALAPGDYAEVRQSVDLTDCDLVSASMDTIGHVLSQFQPAAGWEDDDDTFFLYNFDSNQPGAFPRSSPGFPLTGAGEIEIGVEGYSPVPTKCRNIPPGSSAAQEMAVVDPQIFDFPHSLFQWTAEFWVNFDSDAHVTSWGVDPDLFYCRTQPAGQGLSIGLQGATGPGAHSWRFSATQWDSVGGVEMNAFPSFTIDPSPGWLLVGVVFDYWQSGTNRLKLYIDGALASAAFSTPFLVIDAPPAVGSPFIIGSPQLWGQIDASRMKGIAATPTQMMDSYLECVTLPPSVDFKWVMQILVDGHVFARRTIGPTERRRWTDFQAPVRRLVGHHEVAFRLGFEEA